MTADQLRECPFCGECDSYVERYDYSSCYVTCNKCMARGPVMMIEDEDEEVPGHDPALLAWNTRPTDVASHAEGEALVTSCCGRSECGGECGNEWSGMVNPGDNQMPFMSDDDVERLSLQAGWEGNRKYMTKADFHIWCDRMRAFAALAHHPSYGDEAMVVKLGRELFRFNSFEQWVNKAQSWFKTAGVSATQFICIDATGHICGMGKQFMSARDRNAFPVIVYHIEPEQDAAMAERGDDK